jgi:magnesium-protoporphyrin IX monomethyl ester (oxidative) cyclase
VFHAALGLDPTDYDYRVFAICNQICRQVFPVELDIEDPRFRRNMDRLLAASRRIEEGKGQGGIGGAVKRVTGLAGVAASLVRLYFQPTRKNELPQSIRLQPAW